jgi:outer membrane immunogenic protein
MRIFIIFLASLLMGALAQSHAADLGNSVKDVSVQTETTRNPFGGLYGGVTAGGQATDITFTDPDSGDDYSGLNADGFVYGGHLGYNFTTGRFVFGIEGEFAWSDVNVEAGQFGDVLTMDDYAQISAHIGALAGRSTLIYFKVGYDWQNWTVGNSRIFDEREHDMDVGAWVVGGGIKTLVAPQLALGLELDYLFWDSVEVDGNTGRENDELNDALEDSDALRVKLKASWYPGAAMADLESLRF